MVTQDEGIQIVTLWVTKVAQEDSHEDRTWTAGTVYLKVQPYSAYTNSFRIDVYYSQ